jgi:DNA-binding transcriptional ArsR family regulator
MRVGRWKLRRSGAVPPKTDRTVASELQVAKALSHPLRQLILEVLSDRVASPVELAKDIGQPLNLVSYHVRVLADRKLIKLVRTRPRRGATEHFYRAVVRPELEDPEWKRLPPSLRRAIAGQRLGEVWDDVAVAHEDGAFDREDVHVSRTLLELDDRGRDELAAILVETVQAARRIDEASRKRLRGKSGRTRSELAIVHFDRRSKRG